MHGTFLKVYNHLILIVPLHLQFTIFKIFFFKTQFYMWTIWSIIKCILMKFPQMYVEIWCSSSQIASLLYQRSMVLPRNEDNSSTISFFSK